MDAVSISSANRLLEAFERLGATQGEGLVSSGPSPVPKELARMFEQLMDQQPADMQPSADSLSIRSSAAQGADNIPHGDAPKDVSAVDAAQNSPSAVQMQTETPLISPSELYRLQFHVAMLRHQADIGSQVTQKTTQGLDSLLRNQS